jgi:hypothetical protein
LVVLFAKTSKGMTVLAESWEGNTSWFVCSSRWEGKEENRQCKWLSARTGSRATDGEHWANAENLAGGIDAFVHSWGRR